jgi:hypothetical protein
VVRPSRAEGEQALRESLAGHGIVEFDEGITACGPACDVVEKLAPTVDAGFAHLVWSFREPFDHATISAASEVRRGLEGR